jgi:hypothetical protein
MGIKKSPKSRVNALIVILIIVGVIVVGGIILTKLLLPQIINKAVNTVIDTSISNLNFDNTQSFPVSQNLSQNKGMFLQMGINKGKIVLDGNSQGDFFTGDIKYLGAKPTYDYQTNQDGAAVFTVKSTDQAGESVLLHLSQQTNGIVDIGLGAGSIDIDLTNLEIPLLNVGAGAGVVSVRFSNKNSTTASLAAGAGKLNLSVYKGTGIKLKIGQGFSNLNLGDAYEKFADGYQTKGFETAKVKVELNIGQAAGGFNITEID